MENIQEALLILVIGMIMVIIVLSLAVGIGNFLIKVTNKYIAEDKDARGHSDISSKGKNPKKIAAIVAAVDIVTQGHGRIDSINKNK